jgi:hypothetical protein
MGDGSLQRQSAQQAQAAANGSIVAAERGRTACDRLAE